MSALISLHNKVFSGIERAFGNLLPTLARFTFAAVLLAYFWSSALTKLGSGLLGFLFPSDGAYVQIFPKAMEAVGYDSSQLGVTHWLIATAGMWAEFILPALLVLGLFSRLAALGMIGFVVVQTLTDVYAHGASDPKTFGAWFDKIADSLILDQRALWITLLLVILIKGGGQLSLDRWLSQRSGQ